MVNRCLLITRLCRLACPRILLISGSTPFCDFPRKHVPARLAIFVAQLGRKFRLFSLTMQRYKIFRSPPNFFAKKARKKARFDFDGSKVVIWSFGHLSKSKSDTPCFGHNIIKIYFYYIVSNDRVSKTKMTK